METAEVDQFDSSSCEIFFFRLPLNVDLSINDGVCRPGCMVISLSTDSDKNNGKKWGTSEFSWGLVTFQGYSSPRPVENLA